MLDPVDSPRTLSSDVEKTRRQALLGQPHMRALTEFVDWLRLRPGVEVPDFDPLDGGVEAEVLFLFEKTGTNDGVRRSKGRFWFHQSQQ